MGVLTVNLKRIVQWQPTWLVFGAFGLMSAVILFVMNPGWQNAILALNIISMAVGLGIAWIEKEVLDKPFGLLLPGHFQIIRYMSFSVGVGFAVLCCILVIVFYGFRGDLNLMGTLAAAFVWLVCYWFGMGIILIPQLLTLWVVLLLFGLFPRMDRLIGSAVTDYAAATIAAGIALNAAIWIFMGNERWMKTYCRKKQSGWPDSVLAAERRGKGAIPFFSIPAGQGWFERWAEEFYLNRMWKCGNRSLRRFVVGQIHATLGPVLTGKCWIWLILLGYIVFMGFTQQCGNELAFVACLVWFPFVGVPVPAYSSLLAPGGRDERYVATLIVTAIIAGLATLFLAGTVIITMPLEGLLPSFDLRGQTYAFHAVSLSFWYAPLFIIPFAFTIILVFTGIPLIVQFFGGIVLVTLPFMFCAFIREIPLWTEVILATGIIGVSWLIFVMVCRHICREWNLVGQKICP